MRMAAEVPGSREQKARLTPGFRMSRLKAVSGISLPRPSDPAPASKPATATAPPLPMVNRVTALHKGVSFPNFSPPSC